MTDTNDTRPWCWRRPGAETVEGPFDTRETAIHDARDGHAEEGLIEVGRCTPPLDAVGTVTAEDIGDMLDERFADLGLDVSAFVENVEEADEALRAWVTKYVTTDGSYEWVIADEEDVHPDE